MGVFYTITFIPTIPALLVSGYLFAIKPQLPFYANSLMGLVALVLLIGFSRSKRMHDLYQYFKSRSGTNCPSQPTIARIKKIRIHGRRNDARSGIRHQRWERKRDTCMLSCTIPCQTRFFEAKFAKGRIEVDKDGSITYFTTSTDLVNFSLFLGRNLQISLNKAGEVVIRSPSKIVSVEEDLKSRKRE